MSKEVTFDTINALSNEEDQLRHKQVAGEATSADRERIAEIEVLLDQCWDLLRQREARKAMGGDPDGATIRSASVVENYEQ